MIERLDHLVLTVADIARTVDFYQCVLGMQHQAVYFRDPDGNLIEVSRTQRQ
jgi:catechol 2,3-dioxygenase-like lactoylglutathione lyase family enzyme